MHSLVLRDFPPEKGHEIENGQLGEQDLFFCVGGERGRQGQERRKKYRREIR